MSKRGGIGISPCRAPNRHPWIVGVAVEPYLSLLPGFNDELSLRPGSAACNPEPTFTHPTMIAYPSHVSALRGKTGSLSRGVYLVA
jgi:hypothetical protein